MCFVLITAFDCLGYLSSVSSVPFLFLSKAGEGEKKSENKDKCLCLALYSFPADLLSESVCCPLYDMFYGHRESQRTIHL